MTPPFVIPDSRVSGVIQDPFIRRRWDCGMVPGSRPGWRWERGRTRRVAGAM